MKIAVTGSNGFMGQLFLKEFPGSIPFTIDIADQQSVRETLDREKPDILINAAGKTGKPNVDWCEDHKEETMRANVTGPLILLEECQKRGVKLVHMSSGCIYEGSSDFTEDDAPNFSGSFYARTKLWTDQIFQDFPVLQLRIRMPFDGSVHPRTLIGKIVKYTRVLDVPNSISYVPDFISVAKTLIERGATGTYNVVNSGAISPFEIMELYKTIVDPKHTFERLTLDHLGEVVKAGRSNCTLSTKKLEREGIAMRPVREAVEEALQMIKKS